MAERCRRLVLLPRHKFQYAKRPSDLYSIKGTEIQIKMFDDRLVFETPGKLPGIVRTDNIRHTHFSRNPKIAEYLKAYDYVKEFGEGAGPTHYFSLS